MTTVLLTFLIIGLCFFGLALGLIFAGKRLRGSCGGVGVNYKGDEIECGLCGKKGDDVKSCSGEDDKSSNPKSI